MAVLGSCLLAVSANVAIAQRRTTAETSLVGIKLYDSVFRLLDVYGAPDDIQPIGGTSAAPLGPAGGGGGGAPGKGVIPGGGGNRKNFGRRGDIDDPFMGDSILQNSQPGQSQGFRSNAGPALGFGGGLGQAGAAAGGGGISYTRWIYKRGGGKYGFVLDRYSRVVQIEAIGLENRKVKTRRGIGFGATFEKVLRTYGLPDSYDIAGNSITMRYLLHDKVVFRLNRLGLDKPHVVTGVLVAAGKN